MGTLSFIKEAGEKLFYHDAAAAATLSEDQLKTANGRAADAIKSHVEAHGLRATGLIVTYDGMTATVTVYGIAPDQPTKEKIVLCCGNLKMQLARREILETHGIVILPANRSGSRSS
jgi:hypothetical protein